MAQISGKVAVVTGAASGMGRALAKALAEEGAKVIATDIDAAGLDETVRQIVQRGEAEGHVLDVASRSAVQALADKLAQNHGGADIVINNAGVNIVSAVGTLRYEDFEWLMNINFWGAVHGTLSFLPQLQAKGGGAIVNVSSACGLIAMPSQVAYCASKFAVRGFTEGVQQDLRGSGILVSGVYPGAVKTNVLRGARFLGKVTEDQKRNMADNFDASAAMEPETAAAIIIKGIKTDNPRILVGNDAKKMDRVQRLAPVSYGRFLWGGSNEAKKMMEKS